MKALTRWLCAAGCAALLTACGSGSNGSSLPSTFGSCDPGTSVQLARPINGQTNVSTSQGSIEIVASNNNNTIGTNYAQFDLILQPQSGGFPTNSSNLTPVSDTSGPHPFTNDFFYAGNVPTLSFGTVYTVLLNEPSTNCQPVAIGSFST